MNYMQRSGRLVKMSCDCDRLKFVVELEAIESKADISFQKFNLSFSETLKSFT